MRVRTHVLVSDAPVYGGVGAGRAGRTKPGAGLKRRSAPHTAHHGRIPFPGALAIDPPFMDDTLSNRQRSTTAREGIMCQKRRAGYLPSGMTAPLQDRPHSRRRAPFEAGKKGGYRGGEGRWRPLFYERAQGPSTVGTGTKSGLLRTDNLDSNVPILSPSMRAGIASGLKADYCTNKTRGPPSV